jgi:hypothetical protein
MYTHTHSHTHTIYLAHNSEAVMMNIYLAQSL